MSFKCFFMFSEEFFILLPFHVLANESEVALHQVEYAVSIGILIFEGVDIAEIGLDFLLSVLVQPHPLLFQEEFHYYFDAALLLESDE